MTDSQTNHSRKSSNLHLLVSNLNLKPGQYNFHHRTKANSKRDLSLVPLIIHTSILFTIDGSTHNFMYNHPDYIFHLIFMF